MKSKTELLADIDRVTAERDAALAELDMVRKAVPNSTLELVSLQQRLTAADELLTEAVALLECVIDSGELTREEHSELEAEICVAVNRFWSRESAALKLAGARLNQCDGCQAGIPVANGAHRMGKPGGYPDTMSCTSKLYKP